MAQVFKVVCRGMATSSAMRSAINHVTIVGGGLMGSGIAQVNAYFISKNKALKLIITFFILVVLTK